MTTWTPFSRLLAALTLTTVTAAVSPSFADEPKSAPKDGPLIAAAKDTLKLTLADFDDGKASVDDVYQWSKRLMDVELANGAGDNAISDHVARMRRLHDVVATRYEHGMAGISPRVVLSTDYYLAEAEAKQPPAAASQSHADEPKPAPKDTPDVAVARKTFLSTWARYDQLRATVEDYYQASRKLMDVELANGAKDAIADHVERMRHIHEKVSALHKTGSRGGSQEDFDTTTKYLAEAEAKLEENKQAADAPNGQWLQLFNGHDLTGWTPKITHYKLGDNYADTFRVEDGILRVAYDKYEGDFNGRFGHLFYNEPFSSYVIRVEYRFVGKQAPGGPEWGLMNSGVMLHGQTPESMDLDQQFPVSLEFQLLASDAQHQQSTGSVCTPGTDVFIDGKKLTSHCHKSTSKFYPVGEWVTAEAEVHGGKLIRHKINGQTVLEYTDPTLDPKDHDAKKLLDAGADPKITSGTISLQSESHPVEFRKVELLKLAE